MGVKVYFFVDLVTSYLIQCNCNEEQGDKKTTCKKLQKNILTCYQVFDIMNMSTRDKTSWYCSLKTIYKIQVNTFIV